MRKEEGVLAQILERSPEVVGRIVYEQESVVHSVTWQDLHRAVWILFVVSRQVHLKNLALVVGVNSHGNAFFPLEHHGQSLLSHVPIDKDDSLFSLPY